MKCQELHRGVLAEQYLNGQLDPAVQDEFEVHILECDQCLRQVETIQTLRSELTERAHQIRAYSPPRFRFQWKWVTLAAFALVVCGLGMVKFRRMTAPQSAKLQTPVPTPATSANGPKDAAAAANLSQPVTAPAIDTLPVKGRNYSVFATTDSRVVSDNAPSIGSAPRGGSNIKASSNPIKVDGGDSSTTNMSDSIEHMVISASPSQTISGKAQAPDVASDETAKELFRLGTVQAPPYTFSGFPASGKDTSAETNPSAISGNSSAPRSSDPTRPYFRNAMNAYIERRYTDAIELLEQAVKVEPNASDVNFYLGICRLLEAQPRDSIAPFNVVLGNKTSPLTQGAHFYLAKAFIQTGSLEQAEEELHSAAAMPGSLSTEAGLELHRLQALRSQAGQPNNDKTEAPRP